MRILSIFIDMLRANRYSTFSLNKNKSNKLDLFLNDLGGTAYTNIITPGPDTPRGISSYFSGVSPWLNGCETRNKWPREFMLEDITTIDNLFAEEGYQQVYFSNPNEREIGLFPRSVYKYTHNNSLILKDYINEIDLKENSHLFISLPDIHWVYDDYGCNLLTEKIGHKKIVESLSIIFKKFPKEIFDHIIIFSDHGFKLNSELKNNKRDNPLLIYNEDRVHTCLLHRSKYDKKINKNNKLLSLTNTFDLYKQIVKEKQSNIKLIEQKYVCFEDHFSFTSPMFDQTEIFGIVNKENIYIRSFNSALLLDRDGLIISTDSNPQYDQVLINETSYGNKLEYIKKLPSSRQNIINQDYYTNGSFRSRIYRKMKAKIAKYLRR